MKAMTQRTELGIDRLRNLCWETLQNVFVALQARKASGSAAFATMLGAVKIIYDQQFLLISSGAATHSHLHDTSRIHASQITT